MSAHSPMLENRLWVVPRKLADGSTSITFTMDQPPPATALHGVVRARGMVLEDFVITIPKAAAPVAVLGKVEFAVSLADAYAVGLAAGGAEKRIACAGVKTTDTLIVQPTASLPAGYMIGAVSCTENGFVRIGFVRPLLAVGANNTIPLKVSAIR